MLLPLHTANSHFYVLATNALQIDIIRDPLIPIISLANPLRPKGQRKETSVMLRLP